MPDELPADLIARIRAEFSPEHQDNVIHWLATECGRNLPLCENATEREITRIRAAVLNLAKGDAEKFLYWLEIAKKDWRDVLIGN